MKTIKCLFVSIALLLACCEKKSDAKITNPDKNILYTGEKINAGEVPKNRKLGDASFLELKGDVKYRTAQNLIWEVSSLQTPLFMNNWVKTSDSSAAKIHFRDERTITMSEKSILVLLEKDEGSHIRRATVGISEGEVLGEIGHSEKEPSEIIFKLPYAWVKVTSSLKQGVKNIIRMSLSDNSLKIHAVRGKVDLIWEGEQRPLAENDVFEKKIEQGMSPQIDFSIKPKPFLEKTLKSVDAKYSVISPLVKDFKILSPKNKSITRNPKTLVVAEVAKGETIYFQGKKVSVNKGKMQLSVNLELGLNILTFQIIKNEKVRYVNVEVERL